MSLKTLFAYSLVALDVVAALSLRQAEPIEDFGSYVGYSLPEGFYIKRQTLGCPVGLQQCARVGNQIACAAVCCYEGGAFAFGCDPGYACFGTGAGAGCCPIGQRCTGIPPCIDNGRVAPSPTSACPVTAPVCTSNAQGAPICSGSSTVTFTRTTIITSDFTTTADDETTSSIETSTIEETTSTSTIEITSTSTSVAPTTSTVTTEIPEETSTSITTTEISITTVITTEVTTSYVAPTGNATITPPPQATSGSGRIFTMNFILGLMGVAATFFLF